MLISFYIKKKYLIYITLFSIVNTIFQKLMNISTTELHINFIYYICEICLIIFYAIEKYLSKNEEYEFKEKNEIIKEVMILIICNLIFNFIYIYPMKVEIDFNIVESYIIMIMFLISIERFCFKNNYFYSHQILSIIIIIILFIYYLIYNIKESNFKIFHLLLFLKYYSDSFKSFLLKYINMKYFINIYLLCSIYGIFELIQYYIQYQPRLPHFNQYNIIYIILLFIILMINTYLEYKIILELGPIHRLMSDFISVYISQIIFQKIELILIGLLLIICCLIYLEMLQLNFCNLNKNLKKNIIKRMDEEIILSLIDSKNNDNENIYLYNDII